MLEALKFVQGAVAKKDYEPALKHFRIDDGEVKGYNGIIALSSPIDLDITATPKAVPFVKAIERCEDTTAIHVTPAGKLSLRSGKFRAYIDCHDEEDSVLLDSIVPEGDFVDLPKGILAAVRALAPFIGNDASRPWSNGILLRGCSAYATNNIVVAEYWIGESTPFEINLPSQALNELMRIGQEPKRVQISQNNITFHYADKRWMRSTLLGLDWPDVSRILDLPGTLTPFPENFFPAVETLKPFVEEDGRVFFREAKMTTSIEDGAGASVEISDLPTKGAFHFKHLLSLSDVATKIDFTTHPLPCPWQGELIRGVILGMTDA